MSALDSQIGGGHYKDLKIQPVEYMHANGIPFIEGCIIKYATRWRDKGGIQDLEKIKHFAQLLIDLELRAQADPQRHPMTPNVFEFDEARADAIGQNGNDGLHYTEDMTDPRNWLAGDWVERATIGISWTKGKIYRVGNDKLIADDIGTRCGIMGKNWCFHARPDADGWIKWEGGECPVGGDVEVEYRMRDGEVSKRKAGALVWTHERKCDDITAYRPHLATKQDKG